MSTVAVLRGRFPRASANLRRYGGAASRPLDVAGKLGWFTVIGVRDMVWAITRYPKEILGLTPGPGMGPGAMAFVEATAVITFFVPMRPGSPFATRGLAS